MPRASRAAVLEPTPLGSLTQPASRSDRRCEVCSSDRVTELSMTLTDGTPVLFVSCRACEHRSWNAADGDSIVSTLPIESVLDRARKIR